MNIEARTRTVYYSPTRGRHYFTLRGCARGEASARIEEAYPTEHGDYSEPGYHFSMDPRLVKIRDYLMRRYMRAYRKRKP